jgi:hypothetical protein
MIKWQQETFTPVTLGHIRSHGCRDLLGIGSQTKRPVRSLCSRMVCTRCGMIGADVRPDWGPHVNRKRV